MNSSVLIIEDDLHLGEALNEALTQVGFKTELASTCEQALRLFQSNQPNFAIVDVMLPDGSGFNLAQTLLNLNENLKLLFLTAVATPEDRLYGLELGAADYIAKPFQLKELILRIQKLLQPIHSTLGASPWIQVGSAEVNLEGHLIRRGQETRQLNLKERGLLQLLIERAPKVVSRDEIFTKIWTASDEELPTTRTIDNYIVKLRRFIEAKPSHPQTLLSVWGVGYSLNMEGAS